MLTHRVAGLIDRMTRRPSSVCLSSKSNTGAGVIGRPSGPINCPIWVPLARLALEILLSEFDLTSEKLWRHVWRNFLCRWRVDLCVLRGAYTDSSLELHDMENWFLEKFSCRWRLRSSKLSFFIKGAVLTHRVARLIDVMLSLIHIWRCRRRG